MTILTVIVEHEPKMWDDLKGQFVNHIDQINADLKAAGLTALNFLTKSGRWAFQLGWYPFA